MSWETVAQIVTIIAALAISPITLVICMNLINKRIDDVLESIKDSHTELKDLRTELKEWSATMSAEHAKLCDAVTNPTAKVYDIDKRLTVYEVKQTSHD